VTDPHRGWGVRHETEEEQGRREWRIGYMPEKAHGERFTPREPVIEVQTEILDKQKQDREIRVAGGPIPDHRRSGRNPP